MDQRKLVKSGYSSLVMALPKDWLVKNKLKHGDQVLVEERNNELNIRKGAFKEKQTDKKEAVIDIDGKSPRITYREISSAYLNNNQYIILKGKTLKNRVAEIKKVISEMIALEVVDETGEKIVAKNFLNVYDTEIKLLIRRMDNIARSMMTDTKNAVNEPSLVENIVDRDKEINKLNFLVSKILKAAQTDKDVQNIVGIKEHEILKYWEINGSLEKIGDRIKHVARLTPEINQACRKRFLQLMTQIENFYIASMNAFYADSVEQSDAICEQKDIIGKEIHGFASHKCIACSKIAINAFNMNGHINDIGRIVRYVSYRG